MNQQQQAILARDMIQMIREYRDDDIVLAYLESFACAVGLGINDKTVVNWLDIAGICDQRYYSLRYGDPVPLNTELLDECEKQMRPYLSHQEFRD